MTVSRLKAPANLHELVKSAFAKARATGELHYFPTQVTILPVNSIPFQLRYSPSLANKPKGPPPDHSNGRKAFDPFTNPPQGLFITHIGPSHFLVLNKFAVVPEHFILATNDYKLQTHVLEESDLEATLACIDAYESLRDGTDGSDGESGEQEGLFAFFNCGDNSGASQPHRHIQLLPISCMKDGLDTSSPWDVLAKNLDTLQNAPFMTFSEKIGRDVSPSDLHTTYLRLYRRACHAVAQHTKNKDAAEDIQDTGAARISYNMAMTRDTLVICPRLVEGASIIDQVGGEVLGSVALNGTLLAGTALVKNELEWEALKKDPEGLAEVLGVIGVPREGFKEKEEQTRL
ncbi:Diadenosine 5',5'''-P1,P4-tetraphosphate phosphorylase 2 [Cladobotryum mycophilum]|uniref:Diadenosine 5',5'''-P1,P4-tetraphosphate phosphorylase 2 n=1 Tax=Cladobotryum mycophilum TaxID=491253 RepID=A0ABR0SDV3_9HYPO